MSQSVCSGKLKHPMAASTIGRIGAGFIFLAVIVLLAASSPCADAAIWQMKQRDVHNTGRSDFSVPSNRLTNIFDIFLWQTPSPGSPNDGNFNATQMTFFDGAGPGGANIVVGTYHWPKGVQAMDRLTGSVFWYGNPSGGETIGRIAPAFSNDGLCLYVVNDATPGPLMAFDTITGPSSYWSNASDPNPGQLSSGSPRITADGRIFMHAWNDRPYGGTDWGTYITTTWSAISGNSTCYNEPAMYQDGSTLKVITGGRSGSVVCYNGSTGAQMWSVAAGGGIIDAGVTINPSNGNIYVGAGSSSIYVIGLTKDGAPLWGTAAKRVYDGSGSAQIAEHTGCLSHDGTTYYFQTSASDGSGKLYAVRTSDGTVKWSYNTGSTGWEGYGSCPIITTNGIIIIGNNDGGVYYAIRDDGTTGTLLDSFTVQTGGNACASATLAPDGLLYLPLRTIWTTGNGGGQTPTQQTANVFTCIDLRTDAQATLPPPSNQAAIAGNAKVDLSWTAVLDPTGAFARYNIYRSTAPFTSVEGMTPVAQVLSRTTTTYSNTGLTNGTHYYYAITTVTTTGGEVKTINSIGPRTPRNETDLQVVSISRTPYYPRYLPTYANYWVTEDSGFGPYWFSAATGLSGGQTGGTQRWPNIGQTVTYTATIRNRGTNTRSGTLRWRWYWDGAQVQSSSASVTLAPNQTYTRTYTRPWDGNHHTVEFRITTSDARSGNNSLKIDAKAPGFLTYIDRSQIENFRENTLSYPHPFTDDIIDWLNNHMAKFNTMLSNAGTAKRVHYDILQVLNDTDADPTIDLTPFAVFPFRYRPTDNPRASGYYNSTDDIDYGLLHEMGHQLGLIDVYQLDVDPSQNLINGRGYSSINCLMRTCAPFISTFSANAMTLWDDKAHGYYGQYMYNLPQTMRVRVLGYDGQPLVGAVVKMYQVCIRPNVGKVLTNQIKAQGTTDASGIWTLPNVTVSQTLVPPAYTGDTLHDNPFGYLDVVATNGVLYFRVEYNGGIDYFWLDVTEPMNAYCAGQTGTATFDKQVSLGGPIQTEPPIDMTELNANDWIAWAQGSTPDNTYTQDDTNLKVAGSGSVKFITDGGFDTSVSYPKNETAQWNITQKITLRVNFYAVNPNGFQNGSPWLRLVDAEGNYYQYQYYVNGNPYDLLNEARNNWRAYDIPIFAPLDTQNGWRRTIVGTPDITRINRLEIHADTWGAGFNLWLDGVRIL